jgi:hypothetical protein
LHLDLAGRLAGLEFNVDRRTAVDRKSDAGLRIRTEACENRL